MTRYLACLAVLAYLYPLPSAAPVLPLFPGRWLATEDAFAKLSSEGERDLYVISAARDVPAADHCLLTGLRSVERTRNVTMAVTTSPNGRWTRLYIHHDLDQACIVDRGTSRIGAVQAGRR